MSCVIEILTATTAAKHHHHVDWYGYCGGFCTLFKLCFNIGRRIQSPERLHESAAGTTIRKAEEGLPACEGRDKDDNLS
jgi:hypothetical protein